MALALKHALVKRDVTHLIFPDEVQDMPAYEKAKPRPQDGRLAHPQILPPTAEFDRAIEMINQAERPGIIVGNGARPFADQIIALAEKLDAPIITTFKAKGMIPNSHPLACGVLGHSGTPIFSATMNRSDLLLVFGASFSNHTSITTKRPIIQADFDRIWAAAPERQIIAVAGDGGFGQYMAEFTTAVKYNMVIKLILLNNSELAKISREQRGGNYHVWQTSLHNPNFAQYAENCGGFGIRVEDGANLKDALAVIGHSPIAQKAFY